MNALRIGRALGIGLRLAGRIAGQRVAGQPQRMAARPARPAGQATVLGATGSGVSGRARGQAAGQATVRAGQATAQGVGGFLRPFRRVGGILWLEVTGVFFLLFAAVFCWYIWQSWKTHAMRSVELSAVCAAVFLYLGASSFWRAGRR